MDYNNIELSELRDHLDNIDNNILELLSERFKVTQGVGEYKKKHDMPPLDTSREEAISAKLKNIAEEKGIAPELIAKIWELIMTESKKNHQDIKNS